MKRPLVAFFAAPLLPALVQVLTFNQSGEYHPLAAFIFFGVTLYVFLLVFVLPTYVVTRLRGWQHRWWIYMMAGLLGVVTGVLLADLLRPSKVSAFEKA